MRAFCSNWTRPYAMRCPGRPYEIPDYELLTTVLSALLWRKKNGSICMITDRVGERYYRSLGLAPVWDDGIRCELDAIPYTVDPSTFWAAGKLYALEKIPAPCVMIDTDFIVWNDLREQLSHHSWLSSTGNHWSRISILRLLRSVSVHPMHSQQTGIGRLQPAIRRSHISATKRCGQAMLHRHWTLSMPHEGVTG